MDASHHRVLITGGASGIGLALAEKFYAAGNHLILVGRTASALEAARAHLPGIEICAADIGNPRDRELLLQRHSDISILVNNAGMQSNLAVAESTPELLQQEAEINFVAPVLLSRLFLPSLRQQRQAAIINISSALALVPKQSAAMYCASKAALHSFSRTLRWQLEDSSVRVFELMPPLVDTAMTAGRGRGKLSPAQVADAFWQGFLADRYEMRIGKAGLLGLIDRIAPTLAERIIRAAP